MVWTAALASSIPETIVTRQAGCDYVRLYLRSVHMRGASQTKGPCRRESTDMARSTVDITPITYRQFLDGHDPQTPGSFNLESVVCRLTKPTGVTAFDAQQVALVYLTRVPNPRARGMNAPDAFLYLRCNYNGFEYFNRHEASYLYDPDKLVYLVRREYPTPSYQHRRRRPPLPLPSPERPPRKPLSRLVTPPLSSHDRGDEF